MLNLLFPGFVNMFLWLQNKSSCLFFFSVGIKAGGFEFGCVGCCLRVGSGMPPKVLFVRWPPDFSIT